VSKQTCFVSKPKDNKHHGFENIFFRSDGSGKRDSKKSKKCEKRKSYAAS
jgi:hypothetical protein